MTTILAVSILLTAFDKDEKRALAQHCSRRDTDQAYMCTCTGSCIWTCSIGSASSQPCTCVNLMHYAPPLTLQQLHYDCYEQADAARNAVKCMHTTHHSYVCLLRMMT
jgi:hypothetical protein